MYALHTRRRGIKSVYHIVPEHHQEQTLNTTRCASSPHIPTPKKLILKPFKLLRSYLQTNNHNEDRHHPSIGITQTEVTITTAPTSAEGRPQLNICHTLSFKLEVEKKTWPSFKQMINNVGGFKRVSASEEGLRNGILVQ